MRDRQIEFDVEIYDGLHDKPILVGGGSWEDAARAADEARAIDDATEPDREAVMSKGAEHFFKTLGKTAGVEVVTDASLKSYNAMVLASRQALIDDIRNKQN